MSSVTEIFGSMVFDDSTMEARLPKETYKALQKTIKNGKHLDLGVANVVANAMKDWAIEKGATHFTHWFQPMTGFTASVDATKAFTLESLPFFLSVSRLSSTKYVCILLRNSSICFTISSKGRPCSSSSTSFFTICVSPQLADSESTT